MCCSLYLKIFIIRLTPFQWTSPLLAFFLECKSTFFFFYCPDLIWVYSSSDFCFLSCLLFCLFVCLSDVSLPFSWEIILTDWLKNVVCGWEEIWPEGFIAVFIMHLWIGKITLDLIGNLSHWRFKAALGRLKGSIIAAHTPLKNADVWVTCYLSSQLLLPPLSTHPDFHPTGSWTLKKMLITLPLHGVP